MALRDGRMMRQTQELRQQLALSQTQIESLHMLEMDNQALGEYLGEALLGNPLMEHVPGEAPVPAYADEPWLGAGRFMRSPDDEAWQGEPSAADLHSPTVHEMLLAQLNWAAYNDSEWRLIHRLIACLDTNGFLPYGLEELEALTGETPERISGCLEQLRRLEPPGLFARDLPECLLWQLADLGEQDPVLEALIRHHLEDVAAQRFPALARALGINAAQLKAYIRRIAELNPRPLAGLSPQETRYVTPDLQLVVEGDRWKVRLNDQWIGEYRLSDCYLPMMRQCEDPALAAYFQDNLRRGKLLLRAVRQRRNTLLRVAQILCAVQADFLLHGRALRPLSLADVAGETGLHLSTVSRAVAGKMLQGPRGTVPLKTLLARAARPNQPAASAEEAKRALQRLVDGEDETAPLSDAALAEALAGAGFPISRRTVAKYRQALRIPDSFSRVYLQPDCPEKESCL